MVAVLIKKKNYNPYEPFEIGNKLYANYRQLLCLGCLKCIDKSLIAVHSSFLRITFAGGALAG